MNRSLTATILVPAVIMAGAVWSGALVSPNSKSTSDSTAGRKEPNAWAKLDKSTYSTGQSMTLTVWDNLWSKHTWQLSDSSGTQWSMKSEDNKGAVFTATAGTNGGTISVVLTRYWDKASDTVSVGYTIAGTTPTPTPTSASTSPAPTPTSASPAPTATSASPTPTATSASPTPTPTSSPSPSCTARFPGDPRCTGQLYYGASLEGGDPSAFEATLGKRLSVYRSYMIATSSASSFANRASRDLSYGRIPLISTKVPNNDWAGVAAGNYDTWLLDRIKALASVRGPVWLCLHHEPNGDGAPADWIAMQQHARKLIDANSSNIVLVGILNGWSFLESNAHPEVWNMPVGTGVEIMGFDSYNKWSQTNGRPWSPASVVMSPGATIAGWGYPTLIAEYGVRTDPDNPGRAAQWLKDAQAYAVAHHFLAMSYYNEARNSPDGPWTLDGERLTAYSEILRYPSIASLG